MREVVDAQPLEGATSRGVSVVLTRAQVDRVVGAAAGAGSIVALLSGLSDTQETLVGMSVLLDDVALSRSLITGLLMLAVFPVDGGYLGNLEVARMLGLNPSTAHRYRSTLIALGLLELDPATRRCRRPMSLVPGPAAA